MVTPVVLVKTDKRAICLASLYPVQLFISKLLVWKIRRSWLVFRKEDADEHFQCLCTRLGCSWWVYKAMCVTNERLSVDHDRSESDVLHCVFHRV